MEHKHPYKQVDITPCGLLEKFRSRELMSDHRMGWDTDMFTRSTFGWGMFLSMQSKTWYKIFRRKNVALIDTVLIDDFYWYLNNANYVIVNNYQSMWNSNERCRTAWSKPRDWFQSIHKANVFLNLHPLKSIESHVYHVKVSVDQTIITLST